MFLLDTDTCILFMKGKPEVLACFGKHGPGTVFLSAISYHELLYGALHSGAVERHLQVVAEFVAPLTVLPFTQSSAGNSSRVRQDLAAVGQTIGPLDTLIAGHALEHQLTLVTGNAREFSRVQGLSLESWNQAS
jgi:tRNA(fMet)-specific endonuclease VapC